MESVYRIKPDGSVTALERLPTQHLGTFYKAALVCENWYYVKEHRIVSNGVQTDYTLFLVGDEEAALNGSPWNSCVSQVLGRDFFGDVLLVCMHAVGDDGEERLADVGLIYSAICSFLPKSFTERDIAEFRRSPLTGRVLELLGLFDLD